MSHPAHTIKSFVLRKGRSRPRHEQALKNWLPLYQISLSELPWHLDTLFQREAPTIVEIGFGMGHSLATMAANNPQLNYIGIEVHQAGVASLAALLHKQQLTNVRIISEDACLVLQQAIPDNSLAGIQLFFPDPWPKKRHHKRRLIQAPFLQCIIDKLCPEGFFHIATDWEPYAIHCLEILSAFPALQNTSPTKTFIPRPAHRPLTKFEQRGQGLGHSIFDIFLIKRT